MKGFVKVWKRFKKEVLSFRFYCQSLGLQECPQTLPSLLPPSLKVEKSRFVWNEFWLEQERQIFSTSSGDIHKANIQSRMIWKSKKDVWFMKYKNNIVNLQFKKKKKLKKLISLWFCKTLEKRNINELQFNESSLLLITHQKYYLTS